MQLPTGSRLGPYEIKSLLGAGGMGEVYRARDPRLNRDVAIKVLRADGAINDSARARFEREARAVAALTHPSIVNVYDFGIENQRLYIVEELIEGESLRSLLTGKPVPIRKQLEIATQIADGLAAAHAINIIHRDLKPENILVARDGRVRILDFGLACQRNGTASNGGDSESDSDATTAAIAENLHLTETGIVLGTASYMSPEQAAGKETDSRSDQFSFGLILFEMATGKRAFSRGSLVETMAAIVREDHPPIEEKIPPPLRWTIDRCLQKDREQRYESTRDLFRELRDLRDHLSDSYSSTELHPVAPAAKRQHWGLWAALLVVVILSAFLAYVLKPSGESIQNYRFTRFANQGDGAVWSPDGKAVAYEGKVNGTTQVFLRYLAAPAALQLTHSKFDIAPLGWSSDKNHLIVGERHSVSAGGMEQKVKLYSVPVIGGDLEYIMDVSCGVCALSPDGKTLATISFPPNTSFSFQVSDPLGSPLRDYQPAPFASRDKDLFSNPWASFSPDGKNILLLLPLQDELEVWLLPNPMGARQPRKMFALDKSQFDRAFPSLSWMPDNRHFVISIAIKGALAVHHLWMGDIDSNRFSPITNDTSSEIDPAVSPDGRNILFEQINERADVVSVSVDNGAVSTLITTGHIETGPAWSAEQPALAWISDRNNLSEIWIRQVGLPDRRAITMAEFSSPGASFQSPSLSPKGDRLVYVLADNTGMRLWLSALSGGTPIPLTNSSSSSEWGGSWSPDGGRFVYLDIPAGGNARLMMVKTSGNATPTVLRKDVNSLPAWSPIGNWILFNDEHGWNFISPDGQTVRSLGPIPALAMTFSKDGKLLYGILTGESNANEQNRAVLIAFDPATLKQRFIRDLGKDLMPRSPYNPGIRLSLSTDGKSLVFSTFEVPRDLWMLHGYREPGLFSQTFDWPRTN